MWLLVESVFIRYYLHINSDSLSSPYKIHKCKFHFLKDVEGRQWLLHDFLWTDIDRITFQVCPKNNT